MTLVEEDASSNSAGSDVVCANDLRFAENIEDLVRLKADWMRLERQQPECEAVFFQSFGWIEHACHVRQGSAHQILIAVLLRDGQTAGIWPLSLTRQAGLRIVRNLDDPFGQFAGMLLAPGLDTCEFVSAVVAALRGRADALRIEHVRAGSALALGLFSAGGDASETHEAVVVDLSAHPSFTAFQQATSSKVRKILRNMRNRLEREHTVTHRVCAAGSEMAEVISFVFGERVEWMKRHGRFSTAFQTGDFGQLINGIGDAQVEALAFVLKAGETIASAQLGFVHGHRYYAYMSAMNPAFQDFSAGRIHLGRVIEECFARGIKTIELMPPASRYKMEWLGSIKTLQSIGLSISWRGRLFHLVWDHAIPAARRVSRMLPEAVRRPLVNLLNRN